jgi:L-iditol 2-dehydrogenase
MKHTYPRAIRLAAEGAVDLGALVSHRFALAETPRAFALNRSYPEGLHKVVVEVSRP